MPPELVAALDAYAAATDDQITRPQAIRTILADWLAAHGFMKRDGHEHPCPTGPATDVVDAMDAAIRNDRAKPGRRKG